MKINPRTVSAKGENETTMQKKLKPIPVCFSPATGDRVYCLGYFNIGEIAV